MTILWTNMLFISGMCAYHILNDGAWHILSVNLVYFIFIFDMSETDPKSKAFSATAPGLPDRGQVQSPSSSRSRESIFSLLFPGLLRKNKSSSFLLSFHHFPCSMCSFYVFAWFLVLQIKISIIFHVCTNFKVFVIWASRGRLPIHERATSGSMLPLVISVSKLLVLYFLVFYSSKGMTIPTSPFSQEELLFSLKLSSPCLTYSLV